MTPAAARSGDYGRRPMRGVLVVYSRSVPIGSGNADPAIYDGVWLLVRKQSSRSTRSALISNGFVRWWWNPASSL